MNKTKKDKYLRKNRDNEYRKHKTRKIPKTILLWTGYKIFGTMGAYIF